MPMNYFLSETSDFLSFLQLEAKKYEKDEKMRTILAHYIVVIFYSEVEGHISSTIEDKIRKGRSDEVAKYISNAVGRHRHNNKISVIMDNFKDPKTYENAFLKAYNNPFILNENIIHPEPVKYFNECIEARHSIAHFSTSKTQKGWNDIQNIVIIGEYVLNKFAEFIK
jgi:hypothetical protein